MDRLSEAFALVESCQSPGMALNMALVVHFLLWSKSHKQFPRMTGTYSQFPIEPCELTPSRWSMWGQLVHSPHRLPWSSPVLGQEPR